MLACLVAVALGLVAVNAASAQRARRDTSQAALSRGVLRLVNRIRVEHGLLPLTVNRGLVAAARQHSFEMLARGYFAHTSADGSPFWRRVIGYYGPGSVGENLLWGEPAVGAQRALALWMASPGHRAEILDSDWREIGVSAVHSGSAVGFFHDHAVTVITADFGRRG